MDAQIDHAHMGIETCIENDQNGNGCVPEPWNTMCYQGKGLMHNQWIQNIVQVPLNRVQNHRISLFNQMGSQRKHQIM